MATPHPDTLRAVADAAASLTPAKLAAMKAKFDARVAGWSEAQDDIDAANAEATTETALLATATAALTTATASAATKTTAIADLAAGIVTLQEQISEGAPPASADDIAERDEVEALLTELGIAIP